jgi:hypothetical protein
MRFSCGGAVYHRGEGSFERVGSAGIELAWGAMRRFFGDGSGFFGGGARAAAGSM